MNLINRTMHRNRLLLYALHLDPDDVYQELAIAALQAIDSLVGAVSAVAERKGAADTADKSPDI